MDCMNEVCTRRKVDHTLVESDSIRWVLLLLHLVNFTDDKAELYLKPFLMSHSKVLKSQKCRIEIKKYVSIVAYLQCTMAQSYNYYVDVSKLKVCAHVCMSTKL